MDLSALTPHPRGISRVFGTLPGFHPVRTHARNGMATQDKRTELFKQFSYHINSLTYVYLYL